VELWFCSPPPVGCLGVPYMELVDIDESGIFIVDTQRQYGKAFVGREASIVARYQKGTRLNLILAVTSRGSLAYWIKTGNTTSAVIDVATLLQHPVQVFCDFLQLFVFPKLGDRPHFVMFDNLSAHCTAVRVFVSARSDLCASRPSTMYLISPSTPDCAGLHIHRMSRPSRVSSKQSKGFFESMRRTSRGTTCHHSSNAQLSLSLPNTPTTCFIPAAMAIKHCDLPSSSRSLLSLDSYLDATSLLTQTEVVTTASFRQFAFTAQF
jgi:hypothetical protein